jgi:hypothetical protein
MCARHYIAHFVQFRAPQTNKTLRMEIGAASVFSVSEARAIAHNILAKRLFRNAVVMI